MPHLSRARFSSPQAVQVSLYLQPAALRGASRVQALQAVLEEEREHLRLLKSAIQGNRVQLLVQASSSQALSKSMQGLAIRLARRLNGLGGRRGSVLADRYRARVLSARELSQARSGPFPSVDPAR